MNLKTYVKRGIQYVLHGTPTQYTTITINITQPHNMLAGKNIIITGGSRGLGYCIAKRSIAEGANVLITGRNEDTLQKAVCELGRQACYTVFDAQNVKKISNFLTVAEQKFGGNKINCLVSNAGVSFHESNFRNVTEDGWDKQMDTNLKGNYFLVAAFVQYLEKQADKCGNVVVITSERAKRADDIPYGLTKVAASNFIQCIASKVIEEGIRVNGVGPGVTASDMTGFKKDGNLYAEWQPGKRIFLPEEVAEVVNFLLSDVSNCISGEIITCDQGRYISHW